MIAPRENILRSCRRQLPQWVAFDMSFTAPVERVFKEKTGANDIFEYYQLDFRYASTGAIDVKAEVFLPYYREEDGVTKDTAIDWLGIARKPGSMPDYIKMIHPMARLTRVEEIEEYPWPDVDASHRQETMIKNIGEIHKKGLAAVGTAGVAHIFENAWKMRGMEQLFVDMYQDRELAAALLDKITAMNAVMAAAAARGGADILLTADDVGTQRGMMMAPDFWRKWFKPRLAKVIKAAKDIKPDILVWYHSDGDIRAIIPELIEIGLDILNPVQPECLDPVEIKKQYGDKLAFWGTIGTQTTMPFGTPEEVKATVKRMIETVGRGGGLVLAPTHVLEPDVPWENICAFVDAVKQYGRKWQS